MQVDTSSTYFGLVPCLCNLVPMGKKQERDVFHEKHWMELDENYEEPLESEDLKSPQFSMEKADLKIPRFSLRNWTPIVQAFQWNQA